MAELAGSFALQSEPADVVFVLQGSVTADQVDAIFQNSAGSSSTGANVLVDCRPATYIEPAALQMVIANILRLKERGHHVTIRVPESHRQRDFWRAWGFPQAISDCLATSFRSLISAADLPFWGEPQKYYLPAELPSMPGLSKATIRSSNFFGLHTIRLDGASSSPRLAYDERAAWNTGHIQTVLAKKLGDGSQYFSSRVVFEAVLNAMRHPGASIVQTASHDQPNLFTVHFWDDGVSMADTLLRAIRSKTNVRGEREADFFRRYLLVTSDDDKPSIVTTNIVDSDYELRPDISSDHALFATILPAVTSDPLGQNLSVPEDVLRADRRFGRKGMGLYVLLNAVVEVLNGSVAFRTGQYFMNVRKANKDESSKHGAHFRVRIKRRPAETPPFLGNLVVVRVRPRS